MQKMATINREVHQILPYKETQSEGKGEEWSHKLRRDKIVNSEAYANHICKAGCEN